MVARRRALFVFAIGFIALFTAVAISEGIGTSIPSGAVAVVENAPGDLEEVTRTDFERALAPAAAQAGVKNTPEPGDERYDEVKTTAMFTILESIWLEGVAAEMGIEVTDEEVEEERRKIEDQNFETPKEFEDFLKESRYTEADLVDRVRLQVLSTEIRERVTFDEAPEPTESEIDAYYEAGKNSLFLQTETRDLRQISNKDRKKVEQALKALEGDNTARNWKRVAEKYAESPSEKENGGLVEGVARGSLSGELGRAVFDAPEGELEGPIKDEGKYRVVEVTKVSPESVQDLEEVESQVKSTLEQRLQEEHFADFVTEFNDTWQSRTHCASDYVMERCANFEADGRPASAPAACYEEDPDGGRPEACPAPVSQLVPAMPGSVTPLEPKGKPLAQRPRPLDESATSEAPPGSPDGGTVPPPTGAPPSE